MKTDTCGPNRLCLEKIVEETVQGEVEWSPGFWPVVGDVWHGSILAASPDVAWRCPTDNLPTPAAREPRLLDFVIRVVVNAVALIAAIAIVPGATFTGDWWKFVLVAAIFGIVNAYLRPIVKLLSLPLTLIMFGLVGLIINTALVLLVAAISDNLKLGFTLAGWPPGKIDVDVVIAALLTSIVVSIVSALLALVRLLVPRL